MPLMKSETESDQYTTANVAAYELIYGRDFISPGGEELATHFASKLNLQPGERVLDVGSGLGGCACVIAREFDAVVEGLDFSASMVREATSRCARKGLSDRVSFFQKDCLELDYVERYDAIISRDVFLHIADKARLFDNLYRSLKPGGRMLFTDYCCKEKPWPWSFSRYVQARGYTLHTIEGYAALVEQARFKNVRSTNITELFIEVLGREMLRLKQLPWHKRAAFKLAWSSKLKSARKGVHLWGEFSAEKPE